MDIPNIAGGADRGADDGGLLSAAGADDSGLLTVAGADRVAADGVDVLNMLGEAMLSSHIPPTYVTCNQGVVITQMLWI